MKPCILDSGSWDGGTTFLLDGGTEVSTEAGGGD
jgi:hypothetical protein